MAESEKLYNIKETIQITNHCRDYIYRLIKKGKIKAMVKGATYFLNRSEVDRIISEEWLHIEKAKTAQRRLLSW